MAALKTIVEKIYQGQQETERNHIIKKAGGIIKDGGLVAFPTETVYGLGADALNEQAAKKIYAAKGRPSDNPLIVHIADMEAIGRITQAIPGKAKIAADAFWPGPLTMIFRKSAEVPMGTTGGLDTVAVRMPDHEIARELISAGGGYVAAPSANTSGRPSPTSAGHVETDMEGKIDMIIDGGSVDIGVESTILDMTVEPPMILRPGAVTREMLEALIGPVAVDRTLISDSSAEAPKAPGMKYRHYAPKAELVVVRGEIPRVVCEIRRLAGERIREGRKVGIIATEETVARYTQGDVKCIGTREDESTIASHLYGILREFDSDGVDYIYSEAFDAKGIGSAVMNRLMKAAGQHVTEV